MNPAGQNKKFAFLFFLILFALTFIAHGLSLNAQFMVDDHSHLELDTVKSADKSFFDFFINNNGHHYNPLDTSLNFYIFKILPSPLYLHAFNILLFYINCVLLFFIVRNFTQNQIIAATSAILFCTHPMNAENLSHITFNTVFFSAIFLQLSILGFWRYLAHSTKTKNFLYLSLFSFLIALFFLETALLFPIYLCLLCLIRPAKEKMRILLSTLPYWALSISYFILWFFMTHSEGISLPQKIRDLKITAGVYLATTSSLLKWYLGNLVFPNDAVFIKSSALLTKNLFPEIFGLALAVLLTIFLIYFWRNTAKSFAILWFLVGFLFMVPASLVHAYQMGMVIEPNWLYFSSMGFFMFFTLILADLKKSIHPVLTFLLTASIIFFWIISSCHHHLIARTEITYLEHWLSISPGNYIPSLRLAYLYGLASSKKIPEAMVPHMDRQANLSIKKRSYSEAANLLDNLILSAPQNPNHQIWKTKKQALSIRLAKSPDEKSQLLRLFKSHQLPPKMYCEMAIELSQLDLTGLAISILDHSLKLYPNEPNSLYLKAVLLANQNRFKEAREILTLPSSIEPRFIDLLTQIQDIEGKFRAAPLKNSP